MSRTSYTRLILAALIIVIGAILVGLLRNGLERGVVAGVAGLVALFVATDWGGGRSRAPRRAPPQAGRITHHPDFQGFIDTAFDPIIVVERDRVTNANSAAQQLFGIQVVGDDVRTAIRHAGAIERITDGTATHSGQSIRLTGIGQRDQAWDMRIAGLSDGQKLIRLTDRTESQASERMRVDFVANASHELLTPLASVKGFIETLSETDAADDVRTRTRFLGIMADETNRMQALIRDLMSLSRIESEKYQLPTTTVALDDLVIEAVDVLRHGSNERGRDIVIEIGASLPPVMGERGQLLQLVNNIIANAMKYGRPGTPITVALGASRSGNMARLAVSDEGEGIAREHIPRLTERFYRVDSGRSRAMGGTGLGLSLVKHIVEGHLGHLDITSEVGQGTTVAVLLPAAPR